MARLPSPYQKLAGRGLRRTAFGISATRSRLWLGEDHLLAVDYTIAAEEYRRFYFRDIEALIIRRTPHRQVWNWILAFLGLATAVPFFIAWRTDGGVAFMEAFVGCATFWLLFIVINSARGAACQTHIRTAVQLEQLPSLNRVPVARKALARLQPLIIAAQGAATPEELAASPWIASENVARAGDARIEPIRADKGALHGTLFGLLVAEAIVVAIYSLFFHQALSVVGALTMLTGCIVCIIALVRQGNTDLPAGVRSVAKVAIGYYVLKCVAGFVFTMMYAIRHEGAPVVTGLEMAGEPGFATVSAISAVLAAIIGLLGLIFLLNHLRQRSATPAA